MDLRDSYFGNEVVEKESLLRSPSLFFDSASREGETSLELEFPLKLGAFETDSDKYGSNSWLIAMPSIPLLEVGSRTLSYENGSRS